MLKPLYFFCLLFLIGAGIISCKKENVTALPDNEVLPEVFVIQDTSEYSSDYYFITKNKSIPYPSGSLDFDIDDDSMMDLHFYSGYSSTHDYLNGAVYMNYATTMYINDTTIELCVQADTSNLLLPNNIGDTISQFFIWKKLNYCNIYHSWQDPVGWHSINWNSINPTNYYLTFRKKYGSIYKYGWIKIYQGMFGPIVMQR